MQKCLVNLSCNASQSCLYVHVLSFLPFYVQHLAVQDEVGKAADYAIRAGYRHIDGAYRYMNEEEIGEALQKLFSEGIVKREDIFITSKLS